MEKDFAKQTKIVRNSWKNCYLMWFIAICLLIGLLVIKSHTFIETEIGYTHQIDWIAQPGLQLHRIHSKNGYINKEFCILKNKVDSSLIHKSNKFKWDWSICWIQYTNMYFIAYCYSLWLFSLKYLPAALKSMKIHSQSSIHGKNMAKYQQSYCICWDI